MQYTVSYDTDTRQITETIIGNEDSETLTFILDSELNDYTAYCVFSPTVKYRIENGDTIEVPSGAYRGDRYSFQLKFVNEENIFYSLNIITNKGKSGC